MTPDKFVGDFSQFSNARFEFDYRHTSGAEAVLPISMRLVSTGAAYHWVADELPPNGAWEHYVIELKESQWGRDSGDDHFQEVLADLRRIELSGD